MAAAFRDGVVAAVLGGFLDLLIFGVDGFCLIVDYGRKKCLKTKKIAILYLLSSSLSVHRWTL